MEDQARFQGNYSIVLYCPVQCWYSAVVVQYSTVVGFLIISTQQPSTKRAGCRWWTPRKHRTPDRTRPNVGLRPNPFRHKCLSPRGHQDPVMITNHSACLRLQDVVSSNPGFNGSRACHTDCLRTTGIGIRYQMAVLVPSLALRGSHCPCFLPFVMGPHQLQPWCIAIVPMST